jgi:cytochrome c oxidase assembly factor CtaG
VDPYAWSWNPEALVIVPLLTVAYVVAVRRFPASSWRIASFLAAMALLLLVAITPFETIAMNYLLSIHLLQNVVLAEWAPLLVVLGLPPALAATLVRPKAFRVLTHPAVALPLWLANYMIWHLPWIYDTALENPHSLLHLEHALYFLTGVAMWWSIVQDEPHRLRPGARAGVVLAAFVLGSPIGLVIALVPDVIYDFYDEAPERLWGLSALEDQQLAGMAMAAEQAIVFFVVFAYWAFRFIAEQEQSSAEEDALEGQYPPGTRP